MYMNDDYMWRLRLRHVTRKWKWKGKCPPILILPLKAFDEALLANNNTDMKTDVSLCITPFLGLSNFDVDFDARGQ